MKKKIWKLKIKNLIEINLRSRKEHQIIEYKTAEYAVNKRNITIDKL
jgi:hypothetical protein